MDIHCSEAIPNVSRGKGYPVLRCDEYIGIVTEKDGLAPSRPPVRPGIEVLRYGLFCVVEPLCGVLRMNPRKQGYDAGLLYSHCVLSLEGRNTVQGYEGSWLSVCFKDADVSRALSPQERAALDRMKIQMRTKLTDKLGGDKDRMISMADNVYAVRVNGGMACFGHRS